MDIQRELCFFNSRFCKESLGRFINVDPAGDGLNWYVYCSNNPINFVDPTGLINLSLQFLDMHDDSWGGQNIGYANKLLGNASQYVKDIGCYLMGFTASVNAVKGRNITPDLVNTPTNNFAKDTGWMNPKQAASNYGMEWDYWTKANQGDLAVKINELHNEDTEYGVLARVPYNEAGDLHWVGVDGNTTTLPEHGDTLYFKATGTSGNDYNQVSRPEDWVIDGDNLWIPTSNAVELNTFKAKEE